MPCPLEANGSLWSAVLGLRLVVEGGLLLAQTAEGERLRSLTLEEGQTRLRALQETRRERPACLLLLPREVNHTCPAENPGAYGVSPTSELATLLADAKASGGTILVDTGETVYSLTVRDPANLPTIGEEEQATAGMMQSGYDATRVREALRASAGALAGVNIEQLLSDVYREREQDSSGRPT